MAWSLAAVLLCALLLHLHVLAGSSDFFVMASLRAPLQQPLHRAPHQQVMRQRVPRQLEPRENQRQKPELTHEQPQPQPQQPQQQQRSRRYRRAGGKRAQRGRGHIINNRKLG